MTTPPDHTRLAINYVDKYAASTTAPHHNMNENHVQIQHKLLTQAETSATYFGMLRGHLTPADPNKTPSFLSPSERSDFVLNGNTMKDRDLNGNGFGVPTSTTRDRATRVTKGDVGIGATQSNTTNGPKKPQKVSPVADGPRSVEANKQHLTNNELLFRRIVNMFNKSYLWTTLKYRSGRGRKARPGRLFRKKYQNGYSENLLAPGESNEAYRSDSFKFERFPKGETGQRLVDGLETAGGGGLSTAFRKVSLTEDYCNPVDFVNRNSERKYIATSPTGETVDLLEGYCDPRDSRTYLTPGETPDVKIYTSPDRDYSHPYLINAFLLAKPTLVRNSSDVEDIYEDIRNIHDFTSPRIITSPISLPTSPTSPLIEFRTSPYYYSELLSKTPGHNINIKTSTLAPYKKTSQYRSAKPNSQTLKSNNFRTYVPKVASEQLTELHKRFEGDGNNRKASIESRKEDQWFVDKKNKENLHCCEDANGNALLDKSPVDVNETSLPVETTKDSDVPPAKPPLVRNGNIIQFINTRSFSKNYTFQENSDEEVKPLSDHLDETKDQPKSCVTSPTDSIKLFEKPAFHNTQQSHVNRPSSLNFKQNFKQSVEFETFLANKANVCKNKPPLQPKKSQLNRSTFGKARPRSLETERVTIAVQSSFAKTRPKSLETPKFEIDDDFFQSQLEQSRNDLNANQIYFLPSPYTENEFSGRIEQIKEEEEEDMSKSRHIYETAFDSKVSKSDDDLDIDEVTHRSLLNLKRPNSACGFVSSNLSFRKKLVKSKSANLQKFTSLKPKYLASVESLTESLNDVSLKNSASPDAAFTSITNLPIISCSNNLTPPSTEPLPPKFSNMNITMTPKSLKYKLDKPKKPKNSFLHATISKIRAKYLSSDSMTSSSNSLESINSSSSNNSRSNSISSHSSDGAPSFTLPTHTARHTKLHILSPISDKSFMDQSSEHDSNKISAVVIVEDKKPSPESINSKSKKRVLQNKNLPNRIDSHQGSDSGISMESKNDLFKDFNNPVPKIGKKREQDMQHRDSVNSLDFQDLPFDIPKLRKKRQVPPVVFQPPELSTATVDYAATNTSSSHYLASTAESHSQSTNVKEPDICLPARTGGTSPDTISLSSLELSKLPFDMPKLRRKLQQEKCLTMSLPQRTKNISHESAADLASSKTRQSSSVDDLEENTRTCQGEEIGALYEEGKTEECEGDLVEEERLPFDMPKLRWRLQASARQHDRCGLSSSSQDGEGVSTGPSGPARPLSLNMGVCGAVRGTLSGARKPATALSLNLVPAYVNGEPVDVSIPLERQGWYHGSVTRHEAECILRSSKEGSYLVRNSESNRPDYSLTLKSARGFMHMKIQRDPETHKFILGQFSAPFDSVPEIIQHFAENRLSIMGAEHMCLLHPMIEQLL